MLTPLDVQNKEFRRALRGYSEEDVDEFLDQLSQDYEWLYMENERLKEKLEDFEAGIKRYKEMEQTIKDTLVMAQKNSEELRENVNKETEMIMNEARQKAQQIVKEAEDKASQILSTARENAREIKAGAEEKAQSILGEYNWLQRQSRLFKVKFRSMLEEQLNLLDNQEQELLETQEEIAAGLENDLDGDEDSIHDSSLIGEDEIGEDELVGEDEEANREYGQDDSEGERNA